MDPEETEQKMCGQDCVFFFSAGGHVFNGIFEAEKGYCCREEMVKHCCSNGCEHLKHVSDGK